MRKTIGILIATCSGALVLLGYLAIICIGSVISVVSMIVFLLLCGVMALLMWADEVAHYE